MKFILSYHTHTDWNFTVSYHRICSTLLDETVLILCIRNNPLGSVLNSLAVFSFNWTLTTGLMHFSYVRHWRWNHGDITEVWLRCEGDKCADVNVKCQMISDRKNLFQVSPGVEMEQVPHVRHLEFQLQPEDLCDSSSSLWLEMQVSVSLFLYTSIPSPSSRPLTLKRVFLQAVPASSCFVQTQDPAQR